MTKQLSNSATPFEHLETIEVTTESMSFGPAAIAKIVAETTITVFIHGAAPREKVRAQVFKKNKNHWEARLLEILEPSLDRVSPPCPVFGSCGGCQWQHLSYEAQLREKAEILKFILKRQLHLTEEELQIQIHAAPKPLHYRARIQVRADQQGIGFFSAHSRELVRTPECAVAHPSIQEQWTEWLQTDKLKETLAQKKPKDGQIKIEWTSMPDGRVLEAVNREHAAFGFSQINIEQNEHLVKLMTDTVLKYISKPQRRLLFDLYGGDGNLIRELKKKFDFAFSVDSFNAGKNPTDFAAPLKPGFHLVRADAASFLRDLYWKDWLQSHQQTVDCLITDPPREGLGSKIISDILTKTRPHLWLHVACDPEALARDLKEMRNEYEVKELHLIDMFPQTFHIETMIVCVRK